MKRRGPRARGGPPPWWPEGAAWPPREPPFRGVRQRFLIVVAFALASLVALVFIAGVLSTWILRDSRANENGGSGWNGPPIGGVLILGVLIFLAVRFLRRTAEPIGEVMEAAERVAGGDYTTRVEPRGSRAIRQLAVSFNAMTTRLSANDEQRRRLLADVTHELRTPLSIIRGNVEGMLDGVYPRDDDHLTPIVEETRQMARLLEDLHTLATTEAGALTLHREPVALSGLVVEVVAAYGPRAAHAGVQLTTELATLPASDLDPMRIRQVLENLLSNAIRYTPAGGRVTISTRSTGTGVECRVADTGRGVPAAQLPAIFDRFAKSADSGGSGLGLAIARGLVEAHGGTIAATTTPGGGLTISFMLPAVQP